MESTKVLLGKSAAPGSAVFAALLVCCQLLPPLPLHGPKNCHIQGPSEMGRVGHEEDQSDVVVSAQLYDVGAEVGTQVVPNEAFYLLF